MVIYNKIKADVFLVILAVNAEVSNSPEFAHNTKVPARKSENI